MSTEDSSPWFANGLRFRCTGCGECCTGSPGFVWISEDEGRALARELGMEYEQFLKQCTRTVGLRRALLERPRTYDCIFLKDKRCTVYSTRPKQCRTFPWWHENVASANDWQETARRCEGVDHPEAPLVPAAEILAQLKHDEV